MTGILSAFKAETLKLRKHKRYTVFLFIALALTVIGYVIRIILNQHLHVNPGSSIVSGALFTVYLPLIAFIAANDLLAGELKDRSILVCLLSPVSRMCVYIAKCLAILAVCLFHALVLIFTETVYLLIFEKTLSLLPYVYVLVDMLPLFTLIAFSCLMSVVTQSPALSMLLSIGGYIALFVLGSFFGLSPIMFTSYLTWHTLLHGGLGFTDLIIRFFAVAAPMTLFVSAGALILDSKSL